VVGHIFDLNLVVERHDEESRSSAKGFQLDHLPSTHMRGGEIYLVGAEPIHTRFKFLVFETALHLLEANVKCVNLQV